MRIEVSKELENWIVWEYPKERLKENAPAHIKEEFKQFQETLNNYYKNY